MRPAAWLAFALVAAIPVACAQVTGLSNDYKYDLVSDGGDGGSGEGGGDGGGTDSGGGGTCSVTETAAATDALSQFNGSAECKLCLATDCCTDATQCSQRSDCKNQLACELDCTTKEGSSRQSCFRGCQQNAVASFDILKTCADRSCRQQCGFQ